MRIFVFVALFALGVLGCSNNVEVKPPTRDLSRVDLPSLTVNRQVESVELTWADEIVLLADQVFIATIPLDFVVEPELLTGSLYINNDREVTVMSGSINFDPTRSKPLGLGIELGKMSKGKYTYRLSLMSGPNAAEVVKTGRVVVK
jgi:hypothetical protein